MRPCQAKPLPNYWRKRRARHQLGEDATARDGSSGGGGSAGAEGKGAAYRRQEHSRHSRKKQKRCRAWRQEATADSILRKAKCRYVGGIRRPLAKGRPGATGDQKMRKGPRCGTRDAADGGVEGSDAEGPRGPQREHACESRDTRDAADGRRRSACDHDGAEECGTAPWTNGEQREGSEAGRRRQCPTGAGSGGEGKDGGAASKEDAGAVDDSAVWTEETCGPQNECGCGAEVSGGERGRDHDEVYGGGGGEWQLEGLGEPPCWAGLPSTQTRSVSYLRPPCGRRCGSGPPLGACAQMHRPCEPARQGRGLRGADSVQCPRGGDVDAQDFGGDPASGRGGGTKCDGDDATGMSNGATRALMRTARTVRRYFCGSFGGGCTNKCNRRKGFGGTRDARGRSDFDGRGDGAWSMQTKDGGTRAGEAGRAQQDRAQEERRAEHDGGAAMGKAISKAEDTVKKESIFGHLRVGEAKNPGPEQQDWAGSARMPTCQRTSLPWSEERPQDGLMYPAPHRPGFRDIQTPGYRPDADGGNEAGDGDGFALRAETVNATAWGPLKKRLRKTNAHIVLAQETRITKAAMATASSWSLRNGWKMIAAPANKGKKGGASGGVAVLVRSYLGAQFPAKGSHILEAGRAVAAVVDIDGCRPILAISAYLRDGVGLNEANRQTMGKIGACIASHGDKWQFIIGGDFNVEPRVMEASGFAREVGASITAPPGRRGTCRTSSAARVYDYFIINNQFAHGIDTISTVEGTNVRTHTPVEVKFVPRLTAMKQLVIQRPEVLNKERVYGPLLEPPDWEPAMETIEGAVRAAKTEDRDSAQRELDRAYEHFARLAELELAHVTGSKLLKKEGRGRGPRLKWRSMLPERRPATAGDEPVAAALAWMEGIVREARRLLRETRKQGTFEGTDRDGRNGTTGGALVEARIGPTTSEEADADDLSDDDSMMKWIPLMFSMNCTWRW